MDNLELWVSHAKRAEERLIEYALQFAYMRAFGASFESTAWALVGNNDRQMYEEHFVSMMKQEAMGLVRARAAILPHGMLSDPDELIKLVNKHIPQEYVDKLREEHDI